LALIRLELHEHPPSPQHEMRQKSVLDSGGSVVGTVANLYVDEGSRQPRFVDVLTSDFLGLERKHHLVPVEAVSDQDPGSIMLWVDQETVQSGPDFPTRTSHRMRTTNVPSANITASRSPKRHEGPLTVP
jgi:sporulation protein YlmC with PRC-barrel domain